MKNLTTLIQVIAGAIVFILLTIYQWLPFLGVLWIVLGIIGFFIGSDTAGKMFLLGIILLSVRFAICSIFVMFLAKSINSIKGSSEKENENQRRDFNPTKTPTASRNGAKSLLE